MKLSHDEFVRLAMQEIDAVDRCARSLTRNAAEADDLVQETYLRALRAQATFSLHEFGMRPWLLRIAHNTHLNRVQREQRQPRAMETHTLEATAQPAIVPIPPYDGQFQDDELNRVMDALPPDLRTVLILWAVDELSYKEMAHVLEIPIGTVMSRIHRARLRLYEMLPHPKRPTRGPTQSTE
jgi:RNA polymerase sigma-70 factor (ECF subfamily)